MFDPIRPLHPRPLRLPEPQFLDQDRADGAKAEFHLVPALVTILCGAIAIGGFGYFLVIVGEGIRDGLRAWGII